MATTELNDRTGYERIRALVDRIEYKPNYGYRVHDMPPFGALIQVVATVVDARRPGVRNSFFGHQAFVEYRLAEEQVYREVFELTLRWERHECAEYFKVDGQVIYDPHKQGSP